MQTITNKSELKEDLKSLPLKELEKNIGPVIGRKYKMIGRAHVHRLYIYTILDPIN